MADVLLLETGDKILLEDGNGIELDAQPLESWFPVYPSPRGRVGTHPISAPRRSAPWMYSHNVDPLSNPTPPTELTWHPTYPDRLRRARRVAFNAFTFRWPMVPIADLRWLPTYPMQLRSRLIPVGELPSFFGILGTQEAIASTKAWTATYPDRLVRTRRPLEGFRAWVVDPKTLLGSANCVEWVDDSVVRPLFTPEAVVRPQMITEAFVRPELTEESLC